MPNAMRTDGSTTAHTDTAAGDRLGTVGLVHPGSMGATIGAALVATGHRVCWVGDGRSDASRRRASEAGLDAVGSLAALSERCSTIISVCPPDAALEQALALIDAGFTGRYVDANAIAPATAEAIADRVIDAGGKAVDGGIIGPPADRAGTTRLYLSGPDAPVVARAFDASALEAIAIGPDIGAASALKLSYAAWTKGTSALLLTIRAAAEAAGVTDALLAEWERSQPGLAQRSDRNAAGAAPKAWRWVGEMEEIAEFLAAGGLPPGWFDASAEIYRRLEHCKDQLDPPLTIEAVVEAINESS